MRWRLPVTLAFAVLLHGGLLAVANRLPAACSSAGPGAPVLLEVELEPASPALPDPEALPLEEPAGHTPGVNDKRRASTGAPEPALSTRGSPEAGGGETGTPPEAQPESRPQEGTPWTTSPWLVERPIETGIGAAWRPVPHATGALAPPPEEPPRASGGGGGLGDALAAHDRAVGLGAGGPVLAAAHDATLAATVDESAATIDVDTDASGHVTTARVVSASRDAGGWAEVAEAIVKNMRGRKLKLPPDGRGMTVTVRLEVAVRLPSGARAGHGVSTGLADGALTVGFDVADIGARPRRVVSGQILDERRL